LAGASTTLLWKVSILPVLCFELRDSRGHGSFPCIITPTDVYHQSFAADDSSQVFLDFLPMPTEHLWSTTPMAQAWLRVTDGFIIVFCIKQRESFDKLVDSLTFLLQLKEKKDVPFILVGSEPGYCEPANDVRLQQKVWLCMFILPPPFLWSRVHGLHAYNRILFTGSRSAELCSRNRC
jgi:hypothetical protein